MTSGDNRREYAADLHRRAEGIAREQAAQAPQDLEALSPEETQRTLHELRVHQIELELQNEELRRAQGGLDAARARYFDLYDLAPVGYLTVNAAGQIVEANLTAATLLGVARDALAGQFLSRFMLEADQDVYYRHHQQISDTGKPQTCELRMMDPNGVALWMRLDSTAVRDTDGAHVCRVVLSDISARKRAEGALHESHVRFELVAEGTVGAIWDWDVPNKQVYFSPRWKELRGYRPQEITSNETEWIAGIHPDDAPRVMAAVQSHFSGETDIFAEEYRVRRKDGSWFWVADRGKALFDETGRVIRMAGSEVDITLRKQYEALQAFLAHTSGGTAEEPFFQMLARHLAQSLGMDFVCIDRLEGDGCRARTEAVWCDGHFEDNVTYALKDTPCGAVVGQAVCCFPAGVCQHFPRDQVLQDLRAESYVGVTLFDHAGRPIGLIAVISRQPLANRPQAEAMLQMVGLRAAAELERLDAETALRASEERYRSIIAVSNTGAWEYHLDTDSLWCSPEYFAMLGRDPAPFVTKGRTNLQEAWVDLLHPEDQERASRVFANYLAGGSVGMYENSFRLRHQAGHWVWIWSRGQTLRASDGTPTNLTVGTHIDITVSKQAEESLRVAQARTQELLRLSETSRAALLDATEDARQSEQESARIAREWQTTFDATNDAIWILDDEHRVLRSNKTAEGFFQHPCGEMLGEPCYSLVHGTAVPHPDCPFVRARQSGRRETLELQDGERWLDVEVDPLYDDTGQFAGAVHIVSNITERKRAEEALRESETRYRLLVEHLDAGVVVHAPDTSIRFTNPMASRLLGLTQDEMFGRCAPDPSWGFFREDGTRLPVEEYPVARVLATLEPISGQVVGVNRPRTNDRAWVLVSGYPIFHGNHALEQVVISFVDITDRKRAEETLRESEERFRKVFEEGPLGMVMVSTIDGRFIQANATFCQMLGYVEEEMRCLRFVDVTHPDHRAADVAAVKKLSEGQISRYQTEKRYLKKNGETIWAAVTVSLVRSEAGKPLHFLGMIQDITERQKAEQTVRESEIKFRTLVENLPQEFFVKDRDFRYLMVNESLARDLGLLPEEVVGKVDDDLFPKELADKYRADDQRLIQTGQTEEFEEKSRLAGRDVWVHTVKTPLWNARGEIIGIFGLLLDITERKRAEEALRDALREKESLLREVHHRVKNNLQVISSLVRLQAGQIENPSTRAALQDMQNRIRSMALLHETLYRSGNLAQVDLAPYLQALCAQLFRSLVARPGSIQLRLNVASVYLDANQAVPCGLLVNELVSNCLKHAFPDGRAGEVLVEVQPVDGGPTVRLRVADNGVGLPADFDLQRLHSLGLHLVSDLAGQLQGQLQIERGGIASGQPAAGGGSGRVVGDAPNESQPATEQLVTIAPATGAVAEVTFTPPPVHCPR